MQERICDELVTASVSLNIRGQMRVFKITAEEWIFYTAAPRLEIGIEMLIDYGLMDEDEPRHVNEILDEMAHFYSQCARGVETPHIEFHSGFCARPVGLLEEARRLDHPDLLAFGPIDCRV